MPGLIAPCTSVFSGLAASQPASRPSSDRARPLRHGRLNHRLRRQCEFVDLKWSSWGGPGGRDGRYESRSCIPNCTLPRRFSREGAPGALEACVRHAGLQALRCLGPPCRPNSAGPSPKMVKSSKAAHLTLASWGRYRNCAAQRALEREHGGRAGRGLQAVRLYDHDGDQLVHLGRSLGDRAGGARLTAEERSSSPRGAPDLFFLEQGESTEPGRELCPRCGVIHSAKSAGRDAEIPSGCGARGTGSP